MHLPGERNATDLASRGVAARQTFRNPSENRPPPVTRILLGPARLRRCKGRMRCGGRTHHAAVAIQQHHSRAASPDINTQKFHRRPTLIMQAQSRRTQLALRHAASAAQSESIRKFYFCNPSAPGVKSKRTMAGSLETLLAVQNAHHLGIGLIFLVVFAAKIRPELLDQIGANVPSDLRAPHTGYRAKVPVLVRVVAVRRNARGNSRAEDLGIVELFFARVRTGDEDSLDRMAGAAPKTPSAQLIVTRILMKQRR